MASALPEPLVPFIDATAVTRLDANTYGANLSSAWCIGSVPNGGYVASVVLRAASIHLAERHQPDTISAHFEYIRRTEIGPAILIVEEVKLGRTVSTLHVTLYQHDLRSEAPWLGPNSRKNVLAYLTNTRISVEKGLSLNSGWAMTPPLKPVDFALLCLDKDPHWLKKERRTARELSFERAHNSLEHYVPREGVRRGMADMWLRFKTGHNFTNASLAYISDAYPTIVEGWRPRHDEEQTPFRTDEIFWYPTLALNLDVKRALPEEGVEWLFIRCISKIIENGRLDLEVIILDPDQNVVALSNHVNMVLPAERNLQGRSHTKGNL